MTGAEALAQASHRLAEAGIEGAARDARRLLAHALGSAPERLSLSLSDPMNAPAAQRYADLIDRRIMRQPVSHLVGGRYFFDHWFEVTPDVLDPRAETEVLVERALAGSFERVLDLGTGSGAILLSLLAARPGATGVGSDISEKALQVAARNGVALGLDQRVSWQRADWFSGIEGHFDLIVSNPPYIAADEMDGLAPEVRDHEPRAALTDGADGLTAYRAIAKGASDHLTPGGQVMVEIGPTQGAAVSGYFQNARFDRIDVHPDLDGRSRVVTATWAGKPSHVSKNRPF